MIDLLINSGCCQPSGVGGQVVTKEAPVLLAGSLSLAPHPLGAGSQDSQHQPSVLLSLAQRTEWRENVENCCVPGKCPDSLDCWLFPCAPLWRFCASVGFFQMKRWPRYGWFHFSCGYDSCLSGGTKGLSWLSAFYKGSSHVNLSRIRSSLICTYHECVARCSFSVQVLVQFNCKRCMAWFILHWIVVNTWTRWDRNRPCICTVYCANKWKLTCLLVDARRVNLSTFCCRSVSLTLAG